MYSTVKIACWLVCISKLQCRGFVQPSVVGFCRRHDVEPFTSIKNALTSRRTQAIYQTGQSEEIELPSIGLKAMSSFGIDDNELTHVLEAISGVCDEYDVQFDRSSISNIFPSTQPTSSVPGALGRVLVIGVSGTLGVNIDESEFITELKIGMSQEIDNCLYSGQLSQPVLLGFQCSDAQSTTLEAVIEKEVLDYGLRDGVDRGYLTKASHDVAALIPSRHIKLDGAMIQTIESPGKTHFDTSSVLVFDNLIDDSLRKRLLNVVKGYPEDATNDYWDDINGPDPSRWVRGGLLDVVDNNSDSETDEGCWGLTNDAIIDICFEEHPAINEFEAVLALLFPDFIVSRLPEAILGDCVSPITANAPCYGDSFDFHIGADPMQVNPSPWADVFGRYPNRSKEKPRFVSVLLYLNDEWNAEEWGAPTKFLDPPTQQCFEVLPRPGRCVIMDQDISHTVVAPREKAGKRPRYSIVWKLVLHPKTSGQDMTDLSCGREKLWPEPELLGSACIQKV